MSFYERGADGKLAIVEGEVPQEVIQGMERIDDIAIVQRLTTGIASEAFIYRYPIKTNTGTKEIIGISASGADEIAYQLGNIEVLPDVKIDKDSDPDYYYAMVRAKNLIRNVTLLGVGRQCKYQVGKGNLPDHERMDEHAFVKSITKAQRNVILHLTSEEIIIGILNNWSKTGKSRALKPPALETEDVHPAIVKTPTPAPAIPKPVTLAPAVPSTYTPAPTATQIAEQQEKLKKLRMEVHNKFQIDLAINTEKRKTMLQERFAVGSLTELSEQQLRECLTWVEELIQQATVTPSVKPPTPAETEAPQVDVLGFEDVAEQSKLKGRLYTTLTSPNALNLKKEEAKQFIIDRGYASSIEIPKGRILEMIKEVDDLVKAKQTPTEF